jgi:hypothetical protein
MNNPMTAWLESVRFASDVQRVIALRMMRIAAGGPMAASETRRMITEKMFALAEAQVAVATSVITDKAASAARKAHAPFRRRVRANRRRLGG